MLAVSVPKLFEAYGGFETAKAALYAEAEKMKTVSSVLLCLSGAENVVNELRHSIEETEEEARRLGLLMQAVDTICRHYTACDRRITDNFEGATVQRQFYRSGFVELEGLAQSFSDFI